nr:hypothetical protein GCM10020185_38780 [Pseudomonas brassicacearum subsp. brassicacearum]
MLDELAAGQHVHPQPERVQALRRLLQESLDPSATGLIRSDGSRTLSIRELGHATAEMERDAPVDTSMEDDLAAIFPRRSPRHPRKRRPGLATLVGRSG